MSEKHNRSFRPRLNHHIVEIFDFGVDLMSNEHHLEKLISEFISRNSLVVLRQYMFNFQPQGMTLIYVLSASHLIVHTWPENRYLHLDMLRCDLPAEIHNSETIYQIAVDVFGSERVKVTEVDYPTE